MSVSPSNRDHAADYAIEPSDRFFEANSLIVEHEIRPGRTISLLGEVNLSEIDRLRAQAPPVRKPSYTTFVVKAVALALREFPEANRRVYQKGIWPFGGPRLQAFTRRDVAVAIERDIARARETVFIDILKDADTAPLDEITVALKALGKADVTMNPQWREFSGLIDRFPGWISSRLIRSRLASPEYWVRARGGAVMVSSPARQTVDAVLGTWPHPIAVSFGAAKSRPVVVGNTVVPSSTFFLSLNFDRRIMTGDRAARFFHRIVETLEKAETEMKPYLFEEAPVTREDFPTLDEQVSKF